jgi:glycosyltransferase involved in cell wall biosynthesis
MRLPIHILHVYKCYYARSFGGVEQMIRQLGIAHVAAGHRVTVMTLSPHVKTPTCEMHEGITVWYYPQSFEFASNGVSFSAMRHIRALAATADILHWHFPWPSGDLLYQCAPKTIPAVVTYHSDVVRQKFLKHFYWLLMHHFLRQMDAIVATSPNYIATSKILGRYAAKTTSIPIGIDEALYPKPDAATLENWRARYGDRFFLFVGAMRYYKDLPTLITAAKATGLPVVIAGTGNEEAKIRALAGDAPNIHFPGAVSDAAKMALLALCRAFVFPSHLRSEAYGVSLVEAAMMGKPMITCEIGTGSSYINRHGVTGLIMPPQDSAALAAAMQKLAADNTLATQYGNAARARFESHLTAAKMAADYLALYRRLLSGKAREEIGGDN